MCEKSTVKITNDPLESKEGQRGEQGIQTMPTPCECEEQNTGPQTQWQGLGTHITSTCELIYELETYVLMGIFSNLSALSLLLREKEIYPED